MEHCRVLLNHVKAVVLPPFTCQCRRGIKGQIQLVIECVKSILVWRRVQIGEGWALYTQSRCPLISWTVVLLLVVSLAHACPTCISIPLWFAGAWLNIQALGCFSNYRLHISLINECEYWWGELCVPLRPCLRTLSEPKGGRVGLRTAREASLGYLCCVTPPP